MSSAIRGLFDLATPRPSTTASSSKPRTPRTHAHGARPQPARESDPPTLVPEPDVTSGEGVPSRVPDPAKSVPTPSVEVEHDEPVGGKIQYGRDPEDEVSFQSPHVSMLLVNNTSGIR